MTEKWSLDLEYKPDFDRAMERINAWYEGEIVDRAPVQFAMVIPIPQRDDGEAKAFSATGAYPDAKDTELLSPEQWKQRWFDTEKIIDGFERLLQTVPFVAETFPVFFPNLGPVIYSAYYGANVVYEETTAWAKPIINDWSDCEKLKLDMNGEYMKKTEEMTLAVLERAKGKYMVGYTDLHPGMDCVAAWRKNERLCMDLYDEPQQVQKLIDIATRDWHNIFDHFDKILKAHRQLSATWMGIPSFGKMHIPSCDFAAMLSPKHFEEFCLPILQKEVKGMTHNIFHLDGPGVAKHLDMILEVPEINAIQWVQGVGEGTPILKWIDLIKKIRSAGKSVYVILDKEELDDFMQEINPEGLLLFVPSTDPQEQKEILKKIETWT